MELLATARTKPYTRVHQLRDVGVSQDQIEKLADADAFRSIGLDRRQAMWEAAALADRPLGLFTGHASASDFEEKVTLPDMSQAEHVLQDYASMSLSVKAHPVSFIREALSENYVTAAKDLGNYNDGAMLRVSGLVLVRQRPGTASGICFITLEDETGIVNIVVFKKYFDAFKKEILQSRLLMVEGKLQREGEVTHIVLRRCWNQNRLLTALNVAYIDEPSGQSSARAKPQKPEAARVVQGEIFPSGRNFR